MAAKLQKARISVNDEAGPEKERDEGAAEADATANANGQPTSQQGTGERSGCFQPSPRPSRDKVGVKILKPCLLPKFSKNRKWHHIDTLSDIQKWSEHLGVTMRSPLEHCSPPGHAPHLPYPQSFPAHSMRIHGAAA